MKLREILQWLAKLLPQQSAKGDGNFQAGRVDGDLHNNQNSHNQVIYNIVVMGAASASVESAVQPPPPTMQPPKLAPTAVRSKTETTQSQRDLLRLMAQSPDYESLAEAFMRREFDTDRVKNLTTFECLRTTRYLQTCMQRDAKRRA